MAPSSTRRRHARRCPVASPVAFICLAVGLACVHFAPRISRWLGGDMATDAWPQTFVGYGLAVMGALLAYLLVRCGAAVRSRLAEGMAAGDDVHREQELLNRILETNSVGIVRLDRWGQFSFATPRAEELLGLQRGDGQGSPYKAPQWKALSEDGIEVTHSERISSGVLTTGQSVYGARRRFQWPDGHELQLTISAAPLFDKDGEVDGVVATVEDISDRIQVEGDLRESQRALSALVSRLPGMVYRGRTDKKRWTLEYVSEGSYDLTGYRPSDLQQDRTVAFGDLIHPEDQQRVPAAVLEAFDRLVPFEITYRIIDAQGRQKWVHDKGRTVRRDDGSLVTEGLVVDVTDRRQAEHQLRLTQFAVDRAAVGITWVDRHGRYVYSNDVSCIALGYSRDELTSLRVWDVDDNIEESNWADWWQKIKDGQTVTFQTTNQTKCGPAVSEEITVSYFAYESEEYALAFAVDITERKRAEAALRDRDEIVQLLFSSANDGVNIVEFFPESGTRRLLQCNDRYVEMSGHTAEKLYAVEDLNVLVEYPAWHEEVKEWRRMIKAATPYCGTASWIRPDGKENYYEWMATPIHRDGRFLILGVDRDVTDRVKADEAMQRRLKSEQLIADISTRFVDMVSATIDSAINHALRGLGTFAGAGRSYVFLYDVEKAGTMTNTHEWVAEGVEPQIQNLRDVPMAEMRWWVKTLGQREGVYVPNVANLPAEAAYEKALLQAQDIQSLVCVPILFRGSTAGFVGLDFVNKDQMWHDDDLALLRVFSGILANAIQRDRVEKEREQLKEHLLQSQKLEAIGTLAGGVAHDFNNVLTGIVGYADLLKMDATPDGEVYEAADAIEVAARRGGQLTAQLLAFARKRCPTIQPLDLHEIIGDVGELLRRTLGENVTIQVVLEADNSVVRGDPAALQQVVLNLAVNARDAMPGGGTLEIRTSRVDLNEGDPLLQASMMPNAYCMLTVCDSGTGIAADIHDRVFEPFFTTKEPGKGTGMGLAMVYGIVRDHGGSVEFESQVGRGTMFSICLPLADASPVAVCPGHEVREPIHGSGHVLVVEDDPLVLKSVATMLRGLGYRVAQTTSAEEAIGYLSSHDGQVDLAIVDLIMPGIGGVDCIRSLQTIRADLPVILSTGHGLADQVEQLVGAVRPPSLIEKPYGLQQLSETVAAALGRA